MADQRDDAETDLSPEEVTRLLESVRRARQDAASGRVYRVDESFLQRLGDIAGAAGRPLTRAEVVAFAAAALERGEIEGAPATEAVARADAAAGA